MPGSNCSVIFTTACPIFTVVGEYLDVQMVSGTKQWHFRMPLALGQVALCRCDQAIDEGSRPKSSNVRRFKRRPQQHD